MTQQVKPNPHDLWAQRVDELGLRLEDSPVAPLIERLVEELDRAGISFRPRCYVSNEWGCPDGLPLIGIPFYLVDPRLHAYEEEHADDLEEEDRILQGLRHEAGHAVNYAYRLYDDPEWTETFGPFDARYDDDYLPDPFSRRCVRHLPGWYAQKHPDEDFAESFAVWLTPGLDWRERYAGWEALKKLEYVDRTMRRIGQLPPLIDPATVEPDPEELAFTVGEFYQQRALEDSPPVDELDGHVDGDLRELFAAEGPGTDAASMLWERRRVIMRAVSNYTGARLYVVKALLTHFIARLRVLGLRAAPGREGDAVIGLTALASVLTTNFLRSGHFMRDGAHAPVAPSNLNAPPAAAPVSTERASADHHI